tara:strand:- start:2485 stop:3387 length:903 start_codon:yes stop_codon:yes gene_type:complete
MKLTILGCYSASPRNNFHTTSQILEIGGDLILIDCGEGTQMQLRKMKIKFSRIKNIFISHLHGDHFFGLIGLISTLRLYGRSNDLNLFGPKGLKEIIDLQLKYSNSWTDFKINFHELESKKSVSILKNEKFQVKTIPLRHRIYTNGFLFVEKHKEKKLNMNIIKKHSINYTDFSKIKNGEDIILNNGSKIMNRELVIEPKNSSYAFCSDTCYHKEIISLLNNVTLLYHESTFLEIDNDIAKKTLHSTASDAAKIAKAANCQKLLLGHFSSRYKNLEKFIDESSKIFKNVDLAYEGLVLEF